jgi:hypothetical protein
LEYCSENDDIILSYFELYRIFPSSLKFAKCPNLFEISCKQKIKLAGLNTTVSLTTYSVCKILFVTNYYFLNVVMPAKNLSNHVISISASATRATRKVIEAKIGRIRGEKNLRK